jgi:hypothetical protein
MGICQKCGKDIKKGLTMHSRFCGGAMTSPEIKDCGTEPNPPSVPQAGEEVAPPLLAAPLPEQVREVTYRSPRIKGLRLVVTPTFNRIIETPTGNYVTRVAGKTVEFKEGFYKTSDPEIIAFLNRYTKTKSAARYPVISSDEIARMAKCL